MSIRKKVGFAAVFIDITRRGALPKEASIQTAKQYKSPTERRLWSRKDNEVSQGDRDVWRNIIL